METRAHTWHFIGFARHKTDMMMAMMRWPNFNARNKNRSHLVCIFTTRCEPLFGWVRVFSALSLPHSWRSFAITNELKYHVHASLSSRPFALLLFMFYFVFDFKWIGENSCILAFNDSREFFRICMRKCNFVCTQSMPIRFMACVPILTLVGLCSARMRVFLCVVQFTQCQNVFVCAHILCLTSAVALSLNASPFDLFSSTTTHSLHKRDLIFHTHTSAETNQLVTKLDEWGTRPRGCASACAIHIFMSFSLYHVLSQHM